jgi:hypothetical protein
MGFLNSLLDGNDRDERDPCVLMDADPRLRHQHGHEHGFGKLAEADNGVSSAACHEFVEWPDESKFVLGENERFVELKEVLAVYQIPIRDRPRVPARLHVHELLLIDAAGGKIGTPQDTQTRGTVDTAKSEMEDPALLGRPARNERTHLA